jgi:hypothetical protein
MMPKLREMLNVRLLTLRLLRLHLRETLLLAKGPKRKRGLRLEHPGLWGQTG